MQVPSVLCACRCLLYCLLNKYDYLFCFDFCFFCHYPLYCLLNKPEHLFNLYVWIYIMDFFNRNIENLKFICDYYRYVSGDLNFCLNLLFYRFFKTAVYPWWEKSTLLSPWMHCSLQIAIGKNKSNTLVITNLLLFMDIL